MAFLASKISDESFDKLTRRDLFAAMALQGLIAADAPKRIGERVEDVVIEDAIAKVAVVYADALIRELEKPKE